MRGIPKVDLDDDLRPARGVLNGLLLGLCTWAVIGLAWWALS